MRRALITGITGQDGGYLAEGLIADGWEVHGLATPRDSKVPTLLARLPGVVIHTGNLAEAGGLERLVLEVEPDEIYNLGGLSSVALSWEQPLLTCQVTGIGVAALLEAAWQVRQRTSREVRFVQASSAEIFGSPVESPQTERTPIRPVTPYGAAKAFAHHLVGVYRTQGMHASACILYNHESPRRPESFVTRKITKAAVEIAAGRRERLQLGNLDARRDWGWAPDYVGAMVRAARHDLPDDYVIATGESRSVRDFAAAAFAAAGIESWQSYVVVDESLVRPADAVEHVGDASHARAQLEWAPTVSFVQMVRTMVASEQRGGWPHVD